MAVNMSLKLPIRVYYLRNQTKKLLTTDMSCLMKENTSREGKTLYNDIKRQNTKKNKKQGVIISRVAKDMAKGWHCQPNRKKYYINRR